MSISFYQKLQTSWRVSKSTLCVGLDPDLRKLPPTVLSTPRPLFEFCRAIVDATAEFACAFKPQIAYFSAQRAEADLEDIIAYIHRRYPHLVVILDAKRSDFSVTAEQYACEAFDRYGADALTVVPFQGTDALEPYLRRRDKGIFLLCRTSNPSSGEIQDLQVGDGSLSEWLARKAAKDWNLNGNVGLVVGATRPQDLRRIRAIVGEMPFLVPGIGVQGGMVSEAMKSGMNAEGLGLILSASRSILYASPQDDYAEAARSVAKSLKDLVSAH